MSKYVMKSVLLNGAAVTTTASATTQVSNLFTLSHQDSLNLMVQTTFSAVSETTGLTCVLQDSPDGSTWSTVKSGNITSVANVDTVAYPAKASITAGDYFVIYDTSGNSWAGAMNKSGADPAPTGAIYTAVNAARKVNIDISSATTAAEVAALVKTAMEALTGFTALFTVTDPANGNLVYTSDIAGVDCTAPVRKNENDSGNGSLTVTATTAGSFTATLELENNVYNGSDTPAWPLARIVVVGGAGDTVTVSSLLVTERG